MRRRVGLAMRPWILDLDECRIVGRWVVGWILLCLIKEGSNGGFAILVQLNPRTESTLAFSLLKDAMLL